MKMQLVVAYEDRPTGLRAREAIEDIVRRFGRVCEFEAHLVDMYDLAVPVLRKREAARAADADLILISCHGSRELSPAVQRWCEEWVPGVRGRKVALVVLLDPGEARQGFDELAARGGMTLMIRSCSSRWATGGSGVSRPSGPPRPAGTGRLKRVESWKRWGLNE